LLQPPPLSLGPLSASEPPAPWLARRGPPSVRRLAPADTR
jgi:hypothetical protein